MLLLCQFGCDPREKVDGLLGMGNNPGTFHGEVRVCVGREGRADGSCCFVWFSWVQIVSSAVPCGKDQPPFARD